VKKIVFLRPARAALLKRRNISRRIEEKISGYAADLKSLANVVTELRGTSLKRLRVGDFRVVFEETATEIIVSRIVPRGSIHE
jgi:mRNA interferase RelE/StbE